MILSLPGATTKPACETEHARVTHLVEDQLPLQAGDVFFLQEDLVKELKLNHKLFRVLLFEGELHDRSRRTSASIRGLPD